MQFSLLSELLDFDDKVEKESLHVFEPMRHSRRDDNYIVFGKRVALAAFNPGAAYFTRRGCLRFHHLASSHKCGRPLEDVKHICVLLVQLGLAGFVAPSGADRVGVAIFRKEWGAFFKSSVDLCAGKIFYAIGRRGSGSYSGLSALAAIFRLRTTGLRSSRLRT